jgi:hypothetical protein
VKSAHPDIADDPLDQRTRRSIVTTTATNDWKELSTRRADGLAVSLLWSKSSGRIKVTDEKLDDAFDLNIPGAHALAAFDHPFTYATVRGLLGRAGQSALVPETSAAS